MLTIFGIKQCSTMQKAFSWLDAHKHPYTFHDYKKLGIDTATLEDWCLLIPWENLVNTRGTTWRKLSEAERKDLDKAKAITLMVAHPSLIKRPLILGASEPILGFDESRYKHILEHNNG
jgi:arsenate reductase